MYTITNSLPKKKKYHSKLWICYFDIFINKLSSHFSLKCTFHYITSNFWGKVSPIGSYKLWLEADLSSAVDFVVTNLLSKLASLSSNCFAEFVNCWKKPWQWQMKNSCLSWKQCGTWLVSKSFPFRHSLSWRCTLNGKL